MMCVSSLFLSLSPQSPNDGSTRIRTYTGDWENQNKCKIKIKKGTTAATQQKRDKKKRERMKD
jgi:hypothetical protein